MASKVTIYRATEMGELKLRFTEKGLISLSIKRKKTFVNDSLLKSVDMSLKNLIVAQLDRYFSSAISFKNIPLLPIGTDFQKSVWRELRKIPCGETRTYGQIAKNLHSGARAVGNACRKNPIQIIIPCHRVVSTKGIGGYAGETQGRQLDIKHWLLKHEGVQF